MKISRNKNVTVAFKNIVHVVAGLSQLERAEERIMNRKVELKELSRVQHEEVKRWQT